MTFSQMRDLIRWDLRVNRGLSFDAVRAKLLLIELRLEQYVYGKTQGNHGVFPTLLWVLCRFCGSVFQWLLSNSNIPGSATIGRGLRLPHPQNIIIAGYADIGEFCTIYHNVSIAWNGFRPTAPHSPKIGGRVLIGTGAILIGDIAIGDDVLIGAGAVVARSIPAHSRVTGGRPEVTTRYPSSQASEPGSASHIQDPYSLWR
jgi:serine O-acetyltransferase